MANTQQYQAVLKQLMDLTERLEEEGNAEAKRNLLILLQTENWVGNIRDPKADGLIRVALNRIKTDVKQYEVFIKVLNKIPVVADIVNKMTGITTLLHLCKYIPGTVNIAGERHAYISYLALPGM